MTKDRWEDEDLEAQVRRVVQGVVRLANSDEASRILGVDGTLEDEIEVGFVAEPLQWIANEIASALRQADTEEEEAEEEAEEDAEVSGSASLSTVVALVRLYRVLTGVPLGESELADAVLEYLRDEG
ncbi:MAG: hypothetical protein AVDCRST_MAG77-3222 [uncultured Chloroflexi bacterium]|uniref:Uncharacterized protein n=1 Tax=uncultured Chloroflexota bacterium TaxID=166587 RepID=A0A6J4J8N5_9CHLR|nr:MAG: hypothetical protein AVDCRST_MAG77-3222 [uncultured Chloroflexota bacterium]